MNCPRCHRPTSPDAAAGVCEACACGLPAASALAREVGALPPGDPRRLHLLRFGPRSLVETRRWDDLEAVLTDLSFLEAKAGAGLAFELIDDFAEALGHLPPGRPVRRILELLDEAVRRDLHFIAHHPSSLFQCLWNSGWWYDGPQAAQHYDPPEGGWPPEGPPWQRRQRLASLLESWRRLEEERTPGFKWLCSLRPPSFPLGSPQRAVIPIDTDRWRIVNLALAPDGTRLFAWLNGRAVASAEGRCLRGWDSRSGREVDDFEQHRAPPSDPTVSPNGRLQVRFGGPKGGWGLPVRLLDVSRGVEVASLATDPDVNIGEVAFSPGGERLIGGGWGDEGAGEVMVWNVATGRRLAWLHTFNSIFAVAVSFDGRLAATGTSDGAIHLWDLEAEAMTASLQGHESSLQALAFAADGRRLASASYDGTVRIWALERVATLPRLRGHPDGIVDVTFSTDGRRLVTVSANATTWIWDGEQGGPVACPYRSDAVVLLGGPPRNGIFADGGRIISLACGATWDVATGQVIRGGSREEHRLFLSTDVVWAPGGRSFAVFSRFRGQLGLCHAERPSEPMWLKGDEGEEVGTAAFSPDGRRLVSGAQNGSVRVWDAPTGACLALLRGHEGPITCVAFSPDLGRIASGATDRTVRVWDATAGLELACLRIEDPGVWSRGWSSDGGSWEVHAVGAVAFSADSMHVLTLSEQNRIRVWDPATGACLRRVEGKGDLQAVAAGSPWQAFVRGGVLEVESPGAGEVVARAPYPRTLTPGKAPVPRSDSRAWAGAVGRHLYFFALRGKGTPPG